MVSARLSPTATRLPDGRVLVAGGSDDLFAELFDPTTEGFTAVSPKAPVRNGHTATALVDGRVLLAGGTAGGSDLVEVYDPATESFVRTGSMSVRRIGHTATLLADGRVLIAGGWFGRNSGDCHASAEVYDPRTGSIEVTGPMTTARRSSAAVLVADGRVLIAGGFIGDDALASAELFDPVTGTFAATGSMAAARGDAVAVLLPDGRVLVVGGTDGVARAFASLASAELFNPTWGTFTATGSMAAARGDHAAVGLADGRVLVVGGQQAMLIFASAELYDPAGGIFGAAGTMTSVRFAPAAALLDDGRVLIAGGMDQEADTIASAELYDPNWEASASESARAVEDARLGREATSARKHAEDVESTLADDGPFSADRFSALTWRTDIWIAPRWIPVAVALMAALGWLMPWRNPDNAGLTGALFTGGLGFLLCLWFDGDHLIREALRAQPATSIGLRLAILWGATLLIVPPFIVVAAHVIKQTRARLRRLFG
jgi:hypothetical protein